MTPLAPQRPMTALEWTMLITLSVIWGGTFFFNAVAVAEVPTFTVVVARVGIAAIALWIVTYARGLRMPFGTGIWGAFLFMGLLNNVIPFSLIVWGQIHVASGVASILNATTPIFTVIVAHLFTGDEKLNASRLAGVLTGLVGVAAMIGLDAVRALGIDVLAQGAFLGAALAYAFGGVFGRRFRGLGVTPMQTATGQVTASSLIMLPLVLLVDRPWTMELPSTGAIAALLGLSLVGTAFAYILYFRILSTAGAVNLLLVTLLIPVSAILLGVAFLGETLAPRHLLGMAAIGCGLAAIDGRPLQWLRRRRIAA